MVGSLARFPRHAFLSSRWSTSVPVGQLSGRSSLTFPRGFSGNALPAGLEPAAPSDASTIAARRVSTD
ncbi:hypothetical protein SJ05684_c06960 [Sinorhizobium sojae CCBAU 05684]|uniref:Uncharacterized protein n=1 Tax=Sinorhizobium sojae CCBAU 05684 TaxID=716928 RepID=A0A249PA58_9HYPH|nr:hypothetical protein SJ05684_c06960 [Sinorhizobium sojae CCBAU 05684]